MRQLPLILSLFFILGTVKVQIEAATHVNISIGHQPSTNPADVTYIDGQAPAELRAGPYNTKHQSDFAYHAEGSNRDGDGKFYALSNHKGSSFEYSHGSGSGSARLTAGNDGTRLKSGGRQQQQHHQQQQQSGYSARLREQDRQNQEFERYIQNYHSGPTVETVFETATPSSSQRQKTLSSSSSSSSGSSGSSFSAASSSNGGKSQRIVAIGSRPGHVHTFERQVVLPNAAPTATLLPPSDDRQTHTIVNHQPKTISVDAGISSASSSSSSSSSSGGYDQSNSFDSAGSSFNKPGFAYDDSDLHGHYPPSFDESQINFGNDGSNFYTGNEQTPTHFTGSTPAPGYLPSYPRPVVTKTIQIAQPALKAKKYEIRHPAVQKEFYDIEERVVIKPAGTIVVELERPVAKIPKGETVLPLGHPHPAVASAYNTNGAAIVQTMGTDVVNSGGNNNQYSPSPVYIPKGDESQYVNHHPSPAIGSTTIGSTVTTTPSYDSSSKDEFVKSNLDKQYNGDAQYVTTTERNYADDDGNDGNDGHDGFFVTTTESNTNYGSQFYGHDETDRNDRRHPSQVGHIEVKNNGAPGGANTGFSVSSNRQYNNFAASYGPTTVPQHQIHNNFNGEYLSDDFYNRQQASKPARLQEQPGRVRGSSAAATTHVVKHEHNIHLPASQHNIFIGRTEQGEQAAYNGKLEQKAQLRSSGSGSSRYNDEAAEVLEIKPYLKQHNGPVIVYAASRGRPSTSSPSSPSFNGRYAQQSNYEYGRYAHPNSYPNSQQFYAVNNQVKYSAPYTSMRYYSEQSSPRYIYGSEANYKYNNNYNNNNNNNYKDKSNFVAENNYGYQSDASSKAGDTGAQHHAHIQIQIPHHPKEVTKPIVVTSTVSPVVHNIDDERDRSGNYRYNANGRYSGDSGYSGDVERFGEYRNSNFDHTKQKSLRLVDNDGASLSSSASSSSSGVNGIQSGNVDISLKSATGHLAQTPPGSRVIAATPAPTDAASASESFHKRRIVVNHPFQTVREVVEHEPITNYHHIQVNEPTSPELYQHTAQYYQPETLTHGALRHIETVPVVYHHHSTETHGNLHYAPALPVVHLGYHHHG